MINESLSERNKLMNNGEDISNRVSDDNNRVIS